MLDQLRFLHAKGGAPEIVRKVLSLAYVHSIRRLLRTTGNIHYAGIKTGRPRKWGDAALPSWLAPGDIADFEQALISGLRSNVQAGDDVVIVGGGNGITAATAALLATSSGSVMCFEGDPRGVALTRQTLDVNGVSGWATVRHAVVGPAVRIYGASVPTETIPPSKLPRCDVLQLDCEGAEIAILSGMTSRPRHIIVETHGCYGSATVDVKRVLEDRGYAVADLGWAEPRMERICSAGDLRVLVGQFSPHRGVQALTQIRTAADLD